MFALLFEESKTPSQSLTSKSRKVDLFYLRKLSHTVESSLQLWLKPEIRVDINENRIKANGKTVRSTNLMIGYTPFPFLVFTNVSLHSRQSIEAFVDWNAKTSRDQHYKNSLRGMNKQTRKSGNYKKSVENMQTNVIDCPSLKISFLLWDIVSNSIEFNNRLPFNVKQIVIEFGDLTSRAEQSKNRTQWAARIVLRRSYGCVFSQVLKGLQLQFITDNHCLIRYSGQRPLTSCIKSRIIVSRIWSFCMFSWHSLSSR